MKSQKILLIVNPISGRMKSKTGLFEMLDELYRLDATGTGDLSGYVQSTSVVGNGIASTSDSTGFGHITPTTLGGEPDPDRRITVCPTMHRGHAAQLASTAAREGFDTVIACGGDGTLNETITGLLSIPEAERPTLGYIPAGSTNDFAASLGLPSTLRGAARMAVSSCETPVDIGRFVPDAPSPARYFSYIASFGIFTAASYSTPQSVKNVLGHIAYVFEGMKDLTKIHSHYAVFETVEGIRSEGNYMFGAVTNTTSAGGIFKLPAGEVSMSDGQFEVFLVHEPRTPVELNRIAAALVSGRFEDCPLIEFYHTSSVSVIMDNALSWSLDGEEAMGGRRMTISCLPGVIRFHAKTNTNQDAEGPESVPTH